MYFLFPVSLLSSYFGFGPLLSLFHMQALMRNCTYAMRESRVPDVLNAVRNHSQIQIESSIVLSS